MIETTAEGIAACTTRTRFSSTGHGRKRATSRNTQGSTTNRSSQAVSVTRVFTSCFGSSRCGWMLTPVMSKPSGIAHAASTCTKPITAGGTWAATPVRLAATASTRDTTGALISFRQPARGESPVTTRMPPVQMAASTPTLCTSSTARLSGPNMASINGRGR